MSQKAFQEQMNAHQNKKISYERAFAKAQVDLQKKERDLTIPILKKIEAVIKSYSQKNGYSLILNKEAVLFSDKKSSDVTSDIIRAYNKKH